MPKPTIVLVHGAWADGSSWNPVATELRNQDFTVLTPPNLLRRVTVDAPYIASFVQQRTVGPVVLVGHSYGGFVITNAATGGGDVEAFLKADTVHNSFAQDLSEADRWLIVQSQRPITLSANTTPSGEPGWKSRPSWAVVGTEDRVIPPDTQRRMAERANAKITEVAGSHVSMVSHPQVTVDAILAAAAAVG